ncbi:phosphatidate cytidylyltransferase [bacterium]|nr:phosphatidate cytidylyltransferase [bacterium]
MSSGVLRIIAAVVAIPFFVAATISGGWYFFILIELLIIFGVLEAAKLAQQKNALPQVVLLVGFSIVWAGLFQFNLSFFALPVILIFLLAVLLVELFRNEGSAILNISTTIFSFLYVSLMMTSLLMLRRIPIERHLPDMAGAQLIFVVLSGIWACDTLAYYGGRLFGRHKFFERVSPKKTWEGAVTGFFGALLGVWLVGWIYEISGNTFILTLPQTFVIGFFAGTLGQLGDLAESLLKRDAQVKDSGTLIPGHGGILDRFDSLLFVAPATYIFVYYFIFS